MPAEARDAGRGMGLTDRQLLWRVELPLALPEIMAGLRIAATTTVGLAALAFFAGAGGLGDAIFADMQFMSNIVVAGGLCVLLAVVLDAILLLAQRAAHPLDAARGRHDLRRPRTVRRRAAVHLHQREASGGAPVGGSQLLPLLWEHLKLSRWPRWGSPPRSRCRSGCGSATPARARSWRSA